MEDQHEVTADTLKVASWELTAEFLANLDWAKFHDTLRANGRIVTVRRWFREQRVQPPEVGNVFADPQGQVIGCLGRLADIRERDRELQRRMDCEQQRRIVTLAMTEQYEAAEQFQADLRDALNEQKALREEYKLVERTAAICLFQVMTGGQTPDHVLRGWINAAHNVMRNVRQS